MELRLGGVLEELPAGEEARLLRALPFGHRAADHVEDEASARDLGGYVAGGVERIDAGIYRGEDIARHANANHLGTLNRGRALGG